MLVRVLSRKLKLCVSIGLTAVYTHSMAFAGEDSINQKGEKLSKGYEEIVVTGERTERSLLETASSVVVFNGKQLAEQAGADRVDQILEMVPNIQLGAGDVAPAIRGQDSTGTLIGAHAFLGGTRPRATVQVDGRVLNFNEFVYGASSIWDVKQIEVFRGPQTTTQGRNAIAGAIFIETNDPTFEFEGAAQALMGNYATKQASLALSGPLLDEQLAARVAVDWRQHETWMNFTVPDTYDGADRKDDDYGVARAKFLYTPKAVPELKVKVTYAHFDATNPQGETAVEPYEKRERPYNQAHWDTGADTLVLDAGYALFPALELSLTGSYADSQSERFSPPGRGTANVDADESSVEGLLRYNPLSGRVRGLFGLSYFSADQDEKSDLSAFLGFGEFTDIQRSFGVFGQVTVDATSRLHLTLGGRWQEDTQDRKGTLGPVSLVYDETFSEFLPKAEIVYDVSDEAVVGLTARKGYNPGGTTVSFATGAIDEFDAETLWSYELFSRAVLAGGDLILSGNLFYTDFSNAQRPQTILAALPDGETVFDIEFANAPSAESYGLELESIWIAHHTLQVRAALGYLQTEITETLDESDPILGRDFQRAPHFTGLLGFSYQPVEPLTLALSVRRNANYFSDDGNTEEFEIEGVTLVDAKASYDFGSMSAFAFVRNATDKLYQTMQFMPGQSALGDPREYGVGVEARF